MSANKSVAGTLADLEKMIAKVSADLEKARARELADAEKSWKLAKTAAASAEKKLAELKAKGGTTAAAQARMDLASKNLAEQKVLAADAKAIWETLKQERKTAAALAQSVAKMLAKNTKGKKQSAKKLAKKIASKAVATKPAAGVKLARSERLAQTDTSTPKTANKATKKVAKKTDKKVAQQSARVVAAPAAAAINLTPKKARAKPVPAVENIAVASAPASPASDVVAADGREAELAPVLADQVQAVETTLQ